MISVTCHAQGNEGITQSIFPDAHQVHCLAEAVYHEARGEPVAGQAAVARVVMNRTRHPETFGSTVCKVVYQAGQFSWSPDEKLAWDRHLHDPVFRQIQARCFFWMIQDKNDIRYVPDNVWSATFFSNSSPLAHNLKLAAVIGHHRFYNNAKFLTPKFEEDESQG